jgi:hypothetical protein
MIPDAMIEKAVKLTPSQLKGTITTLFSTHPVIEEWFSEVEFDFLSALQGAHDLCDSPVDMEIRLRNAAAVYGVSIPA